MSVSNGYLSIILIELLYYLTSLPLVVLFLDGKRLTVAATACVLCLLASNALCLDKYESIKTLFSFIISFLPSGSSTKIPQKVFIPEYGCNKL